MKVLVVPLIAFSVLIARPPSRPIPHPDYGVVTSVQFLEGISLDRIQTLGVGSIRVGFGWNLVEPQKGRFDFTQMQSWIDNAHAAGLHIYIGLGDPPPWAAPCAVCMPYSLWDWYDYVYRVISRFSYLGTDVTFGIWNEPNLKQFLTPPQPDLYADLFDYADMARLDANPAAPLGGPEVEHGAVASGWFAAAMSRMERRLRPQDVLTVHWYPGTRSPDLSLYMRDVVARAGKRSVWLTETGKKAADDLDQSQGLMEIVTTFNRRPSAQWAKLFVYRLAGQDPTDSDLPFQLLRPDAAFSIRPAFDAYREHMYRMLTISLQAADGRWVSAENNGGSAVRADGAAAGPWETFELDDLNGGTLRTNDLVRVKTSLGAGLEVLPDDESVRAIDWCGCADAGVFVVTSIDASSAPDGGRIALWSYVTGSFLSTGQGRDGDLLANSFSMGAPEMFRLTLR